jgi:hypothetical protein
VRFAVLLVAGLLLLPATTRASDTFVFYPEADTYVDLSQPNLSFGQEESLHVDASPRKQALLRFRVTGLAGRVITSVHLRLYQKDSSPSGGIVRSAPSAWSEATTWGTRPEAAGPELARFGAVERDSWYDVDLGQLLAGDGTVSLAVDPVSDNQARWASRESPNPPQLVVAVASVPGLVIDGLSLVADENVGSDDPTCCASNRRLAVTEHGRLLAVHGRHADGVQLAWRDPGSGWRNVTRGAVQDGVLLGGTKSGDWPASLAIARGSDGREHAWVVWAGEGFGTVRPIQMCRLSELDAADGPVVGPVLTIEAAPLGDARPDLAFGPGPDGRLAGYVVWTRRTGAARFELVSTRFDGLEGDAPRFHGPSVVSRGRSDKKTGTLVPTTTSMLIVARGEEGSLQIFEPASRSARAWRSRSSAPLRIDGSGKPSAVVLGSGDVLAAVESDSTKHIVSVVRFPSKGKPQLLLRLAGYAEPTLAAAGTRAWLIAVRTRDGSVISRRFGARPGWDRADRVEIGQEAGGHHAWPNALREADGRLRFVVRGPAGLTPVKSSVLAYQRPLGVS